MPALATGLGRIPGVYEGDDPTGTFSLVRESLHQVAPPGIQDTLCEVAMHHAGDHEVFERDSIVAGREIVRQLVQIVVALIADPLVLALQHHDCFAAVLAAPLPPCDPSLGDPQGALGSPIEARMSNLFAVAGGDQARQPHIDPNIFTRRIQRRWLVYHAREHGVPLARPLGDAERLYLPFERTVP